MNKIVIDGEISQWGFSARWLSSKLSDISGDVEVVISSFGGDVFEGVSMFNALKQYAKEKGEVTTVIDGKAMSIASLIFLAGCKKKAYDNSTYMIHKAWTWLAGNSDDLLKEAKILDGIDNVLANEYSKHMGKDKDEILKLMSDESWYIGKQQMIDLGFIDEFIATEGEVDVLAKNNFKSAMARFSAEAKEKEIKVDFDKVKLAILSCSDGKCPMGDNHIAMPSENVKLAKNSNTGADMEFNKENFDLLNEQGKVFALRINTLETREKNFKAQLDEYASTLDAKEGEMSAMNEKLADVESKLSEVEAKFADAETRVNEAMECGVDAVTLTAMLKADSHEDASKLLNDFRASHGGTVIQDNTEPDNKQMPNLMAYANLNKGSIR